MTRDLDWLRAAVDDVEVDALVTRQHARQLVSDLTPAVMEALGHAWDRGWSSGSYRYWSKPRNPYTGQMNDDDAEDYCVSHGGTGTPDDCSASPAPLGQPCPGVTP